MAILAPTDAAPDRKFAAAGGAKAPPVAPARTSRTAVASFFPAGPSPPISVSGGRANLFREGDTDHGTTKWRPQPE